MQIILGYFFIAFSVVSFLSVASFSPMDAALLVSMPAFPPENIVGGLGSTIATYMILIYGRYGSYLLSFGMLIVGINILIKAKPGRILIKASLFFISSIALSVLVSALKPGSTYVNAGMLGMMMDSSLEEVMPRGVVIGIFGLLFLLTLSASMKIFRKITVVLARTFGQIVMAPFRLLGLIHKDQDEEHVPELDTEFDPRSSARNEESTVMHARQAETVSTPSPFNAHRPEPDFLRGSGTPELEEGEEGPAHASPLYSDLAEPDWLSAPGDRAAILQNISDTFHPLIYDKAPDAPRTLINRNQEDEEEMEAIRQGLADDIKAEPAKVEPVMEEKTEAGPPQDSSKKTKGKGKIKYYFPDSNILEQSLQRHSKEEIQAEIDSISNIIETTFENFKISIKVTGYSRGPAITRYELVPPVGLKVKSIYNLQDDLALNLGTKSIRIVAPINNQNLVGVEVPNKHRQSVVLRDIVERKEFMESDAHLPLILGKSISGKILIEDLSEMPHLLIAGTTGSGKSVYVNSLIAGLLFRLREDELKFIMIDPKMVELELYNGIPHLLAPVITQPEEALAALEWAVKEMDRRYSVLSDNGVRSIFDYNDVAKEINVQRRKDNVEEMEVMPYIIIVIDEFANLMLRSPKETEKSISRLAAMARAVGMHLVIATQRPSVDVVTGIIKANFPSRIAFRVSSRTDSRTIMDKNGAESLLGRGDMLFMTPTSNDINRIQAPFVSNIDVESVVNDLKRNGTADYQIDFEQQMEESLFGDDNPNLTVDAKDDPMFGDALKTAVANGEISASYLQRKFRVGYNRASRLVEGMDQLGILGPATNNSKPREVLIRQEDLVHYL